MPQRDFYRDTITKIFTEKSSVLDIGGGLRVRKGGDRYNPHERWLHALLGKVDYKVLNPTPEYGADVIGDIHNLPFADNSQDAIICAAVLEHVKDPIRASQELYRVLKSGGHLYVYVPFLYFYHAPRSGLYGDYWRFTEDALRLLFKNFSSIAIEPVRGATETWFSLNPITRSLLPLGRLLDRLFGKRARETKGVNGYAAFLIK